MACYKNVIMDFSILGVKYDKTQTCRSGSSGAPELIRGHFTKMETYVSGVDLADHFIEDLGDVSELEDVSKISKAKGFPIIIGGEHSVTLEAVKTLKPEVVIVLDAHPDCEEGSGHNAVVRNMIKEGFDVRLLGVRTFSKKEEEFLRDHDIRIEKDDLKKIKGKVFLSIDLDVFDPSIIKNVGNPEPDGCKFKDVVKDVRILADKLIGVDVVEYTPGCCNEVESYLVAKLIYAIMAEIVKNNKL